MAHLPRHILLLLVTLYDVEGLQLYVQPKEFYTYDTNIKLICVPSSNHTADAIEDFQTLKIEKQFSNSRWALVADIHFDGKINTKDFAIVTDGIVGKPSETFLSVTWNVATPGRFGTYRCEAFGDSAVGGYTTEKTDSLEVRCISRLTAELFTLIRSLDLNLIQKIYKVAFRLHRLNRDVENSFSHARAQFKQLAHQTDIIESLLKTQIVKTLSHIESSITGLESYANILNYTEWPEGEFSLLSPEAGCPSGVAENGMMQFFLGNGSYYYAAHMEVIGNSSDFYLYFCSTSPMRTSQIPWPAGSYCINQHSATCPKGFHSSSLTYDLPNGEDFAAYGKIPTGDYSTPDKVEMYFCCRHDGDPSVAVALPMSEPFYLYRHKGACQVVMGMDVSSEKFKIETSTDDGGDQRSETSADFLPDFTIRPIVGELCYYYKYTI